MLFGIKKDGNNVPYVVKSIPLHDVHVGPGSYLEIDVVDTDVYFQELGKHFPMLKEAGAQWFAVRYGKHIIDYSTMEDFDKLVFG